MGKIAHLIQIILATIIGYFIATLVLIRTFITFVRSPVKFVSGTFFNKRKVMPTCLNDPSLGNHGFIHLEEVKLHYVACGDESKPLMLCLHGFPEFWYSWRYQIREFSKDYRVVAIDQRGYADSDKPSGYKNYTYEHLTNDIKQLIPALGYSSCTLLSHDWGGAVAWQFASRYPELVDKLVVCNCPHPGTFQKYVRGHWSQFKKSWYMYFFQVPWVPELAFRANDLSFFNRVFKAFKNNKPSDEDIEAYKYTFAQKGALTGPINYYRAAFSSSIRPCKTKINIPVLVVWGDPDEALNTELAELAGEYVTNLTVKVIRNSNHFVNVDRPNECNAVIREFLQGK
ncbi:epoxide hydrolase 4-like isoform X1 [Mercenaria mercenaria]|uniref:epoxide hydrolase 4-like isoform X1 n=1 Tax=Mercenaria mercenaria TaxID=6596 RepID=UPI00234EE1DF|nr:epoxide hydrolase 4-like isoform X1 [Mercenaria mercenaria]